MEEVKEPTPEEIEFEKELRNLEIARKSVGEVYWEEVRSQKGRELIFGYVRHFGPVPVSEGDSLHCHDKVFKTGKDTYQFVWAHTQSLDEFPMSISRGVDYNWDDKIKELRLKYAM
jgi:hypothetical protein